MKPLHSFDTPLLAVARGFTAAALLLFGLPWVLMLFNVVLALVITLIFPISHSVAWSGVNLSLSHLFDHPVGLAYSLFWFATVRSLPSKAARICLGASSAFCIFIAVVGVIPFLIHPHLLALVFMFLDLICLIGFTSMLWVSIRPPSEIPLIPSNLVIP